MNIEGRLTIGLTIEQGRVVAANIASSRPVHASGVLIGRQVVDAQKMIPLMFSLCGTAQACAGVRACEQALNRHVTAEVQVLRDCLVNMETLREHMWRTLLDWPAFIDDESQPDRLGMAEMVRIQRDYQQALCADTNVFQPGAMPCRSDIEMLKSVLARLSGLFRRTVFGMLPIDWPGRMTGEQALTEWAAAGQSIAARLIHQLIRSDWRDTGACAVEGLPVLETNLLNQAMRDEHYIEQPTWQGRCCETTSLTRLDSPLLAILKRTYGNGMLTRLVARLTEIALLADQLNSHLEGQCSTLTPEPVAANPGIGQAAAARGQLVHRVELDGTVIVNYQILAPTEWNFHPKGVVVESLLTLKGTSQKVEQQARLLINAIDPCVGYELNLEAL